MLEDLNIPEDYDGLLYLAESVRNPPVLSRHHHVELELNVVAEGEITYIVDGRRSSFGKRSLLWMFPSQEHQLVDRSADARYYVAVFKPGLIKRACRRDEYLPLRSTGQPGQPVLHCELKPAEFDLTCRIMDGLMGDGPDSATLNRECGFGAFSDFAYRHSDPDWLNAGLRHLLLLSWRQQRGRQGSRREVTLHATVAKAVQILGETDAPDDFETLARQCGVSSAYLSRLFRKQIGVSLTRYRNSVRLTRFWGGYRDGSSRSLLEAALAAGFGSYAQFFRVFTQTYGTNPRTASPGGRKKTQ